MNPPYRELEHTADTGLEVWGNTHSELFINAARGMYTLIWPEVKFPGTQHFQFELRADSYEELLVNFLSELNYYILMQRKLINPIENIKIETQGDLLALTCDGNIFKLGNEHLLNLREIKSVTYHQLKISHEGSQLYTKIIFDI